MEWGWGMRKEQNILAISRRTQHDQKHVSNDAKMFEMVVLQLGKIGYAVKQIDEDALAEYLDSSRPGRIVSMAQRPENTALLAQLEAEGCVIINSFYSVMNTYRVFMALRLADLPLPFARSKILSSLVEEELENFEEEAYTMVAKTLGEPFYIKRGDIHAAHPNDVVCIASRENFANALEDFRERGVRAAIVQEHCEGTVVKFYAVSGKKFFHAQNFETGITVEFDTTALEEQAERIAGVLGLTIYGGDVVITPEGDLLFIDFNAWPSFGSVRDKAVPAMVKAIVEVFDEERMTVDTLSDTGETI